MGFLSALGRFYVVVVNIVFLLVGLVLFVAGMIGRFGDSITGKYLDAAQTSLKETIVSTGLGDENSIDIDMNQLLMTASIVFISIGVFLLIVTFLGCCGACYEMKGLLTIYVAICCILLIAEIVVVCLLYTSNVVSDPIKSNLKQGIEDDYEGLGGSNFVSVAWNILMIQADCCGVEGYEDFHAAKNWNRSTSNPPQVNLLTPVACCKTLPSSDDTSCAENATTTELNNMEEGCFDKYWEWTLGNTPLVAGVLSGVGVFQLLLIISGILIICTEQNNENNKVSQRPDHKRSNGRKRNYW